MKYAVIETSGAQYQVSEGRTVELEKIEGDKGTKVTFDKVLLIADGENVEIGKPYLEGKQVIGEVEEQYKDKKLYVFKYRSKSRYRRKTGHRQEKTKIKINKIS